LKSHIFGSSHGARIAPIGSHAEASMVSLGPPWQKDEGPRRSVILHLFIY
jgi:hypothetical protein